ncbi:MAG: FAD-dependent 5-carboxymethylaminomethyl-2-thiouridine(34) oxidoreductase MnmC [Burkholderiales bacterium]
MKTSAIQAAKLCFNPQGVPWSETFGDVYHPRAGAFAQARHVFLAGNQLPARWQEPGRRHFVILETGFGLGNNFLATWQTWRDLPEPRPALDFISIERHPFTRADLTLAHAQSPCPDQAGQLLAQWPALTWNLHTLRFEAGQLRLFLAFGDALEWLPELLVRVDAFYLDGFAPARNPELWQLKVFKTLGRLAAPGATAATWSAARVVREGLLTAGFLVNTAPGLGGKRDITLARYAPRFTPRPSPRLARLALSAEPSALIIGAGLAGCATARSLARLGWRSTLLDRAVQPASEASGNPAGIFHGIVHGQDGTHSRILRAAALYAAQEVRQAIVQHGIHGQVNGVVRLEWGRKLEKMSQCLTQWGLSPDYVRACSAEEASALSGWPVPTSAWLFTEGGWVAPAELCRAYLNEASEYARFVGGASVAIIERRADQWCALNSEGQMLGQAPVLVLANAGDALRLLNWPRTHLDPVRGQLSWFDKPADAPALGWPLQRSEDLGLPVAGAGYALPPLKGLHLFGATSQAHDTELVLRDTDHAANLQQLHRLQGRSLNPEQALAAVQAFPLQGRVAWRWTTPDKLPMVGPVPRLNAPPRDHVRLIEREPGLFLCAGLGSRGISLSALAGEILAALITGRPCPLESSLLDAIDPARF